MFWYKPGKPLRTVGSIILLVLVMGPSCGLAGASSVNHAACSDQVTAENIENNATQQPRNPCNLNNRSGDIQLAIELPENIKDQLKIDAGFGWGIFNGNIYNGNSEYVITRLTISMEPIHDGHHIEMMADMSHEVKIHQIDLNLAPLTQGALSMVLHEEDAHVHNFKWEIIKVFGYKQKI